MGIFGNLICNSILIDVSEWNHLCLGVWVFRPRNTRGWNRVRYRNCHNNRNHRCDWIGHSRNLHLLHPVWGSWRPSNKSNDFEWSGRFISNICIHFWIRGVFTCSILKSIVTILPNYCGNTWKLYSPANVILARNGTMLVNFEVILKRFCVKINFKSQFQSNGLLWA